MKTPPNLPERVFAAARQGSRLNRSRVVFAAGRDVVNDIALTDAIRARIAKCGTMAHIA
jgi:hypothetical protein